VVGVYQDSGVDRTADSHRGSSAHSISDSKADLEPDPDMLFINTLQRRSAVRAPTAPYLPVPWRDMALSSTQQVLEGEWRTVHMKSLLRNCVLPLFERNTEKRGSMAGLCFGYTSRACPPEPAQRGAFRKLALLSTSRDRWEPWLDLGERGRSALRIYVDHIARRAQEVCVCVCVCV